jgi:hypothetical protein
MTDAQTEYNPDPDWFDERTSESELSEALREDTAEALDPESAAFIRFLVDKVWQFVVEFAGVESFPFPYQEEFGKRIVESLIIGDGSTITGEQSRQCLDGDTVIFRRDGTACRIRDHEDAWVTGEKPVKRYTFRGGASVVATDNHPFWTANGWVQAGQLQVGDKVATLDDWDRWAGKQFIRSTFERGRWKQQVLYERKITDSLCRLLGYFVADGSHRPGQSAKFTNITAQYLDEFDFMLEENFGFRAKWYAKGKGWDLLLTTDSKSSHDNDFRDFLHALRWDDGFPTDVFSWRRDQVAEFVNRAWSADGCIHIKQVNVSTSGQRSYPEIFMSCGNGEVYARYWQALLWKFGVSSTVKEEWMSKSTKPFFRLVVGGGERNVKRFFDSFGLIYGKEAKSSEALACAGKFSKSWGVDWVDVDGEQFHWSALLKVEELGVRQVWDVTYEGKGWFVGQGVKVSNSGKTELLANTIAGLMVLLPRLAVMYPKHLGKFKRGLWVGCFAPVESQVATLFGRVVDRLTSERALEIMSDPDIDEVPSANKSRELILKRSGSLVRMSTANPRAKIEGKSYHWIIIDEAQDVDEYVMNKSISPMGAFYLATICKIGTPNVVKGDFYKSIQYNKRQELTRGGKKNHFRYPWEYCAKSNPNYKKYIKQEALKYGEDSDEFRLNYKLEWLLDRGMFLPENDAEIMGDTTQGIVDSYWKSPVVVGIDPARRMDSTVVTVVYVDWEHPDEFGFFVHRILNWLEIHGEDWEEQYFRIVDFLQNYNVLAVGVDAQGVGDAVAQRLQRLMPNTQVVSLMSSPKDQSERWKHLQALLQRRMIVWPAHPKTRRLKLWKRFMSQMTDLEKQYRGGYLLAEAPDEKGAHDDFPDSLALACVLTRDFVVPESEMTDAPWANYRRQ